MTRQTTRPSAKKPAASTLAAKTSTNKKTPAASAATIGKKLKVAEDAAVASNLRAATAEGQATVLQKQLTAMPPPKGRGSLYGGMAALAVLLIVGFGLMYSKPTSVQTATVTIPVELTTTLGNIATAMGKLNEAMDELKNRPTSSPGTTDPVAPPPVIAATPGSTDLTPEQLAALRGLVDKYAAENPPPASP